MGVSKDIETRSHVTGFREEIGRAAESTKSDFFTWFNAAKDVEASFVQGAWEFSAHVAAPLFRTCEHPEDLTVVEIGHGGGRLLSAASRYFKHAVGVDVHNQNDLVLDELKRRGIHNVELHQTDGRTIPLADNSVHVVYSFIVLQHVERIDILRNYVEETFRVLAPSGMAVLYFGRRCLLSLNRPWRLLYWLDRAVERVLLPRGYREQQSRVNDVNLRLALFYGKRLARQCGFEVMETLVSHKPGKNQRLVYRGQHGLLLKKP